VHFGGYGTIVFPWELVYEDWASGMRFMDDLHTHRIAEESISTIGTLSVQTGNDDEYEPAPAPEPIVRYIISAPSQARRNQRPTITFQGEPNAQYYLRIVSAAGNTLTADGLGLSTANANGVVSWTWLVGGGTGAGRQSVTIRSGGVVVARHEIEIIVG
jgi:hypothetical protein